MHPTAAPPRHRRGTTAPVWRPAPGLRPAELVLTGAHGGAGTTTLAALLAPAWDMGPARAGLRAGGRPVVLVAGSTVAAAGRAAAAITAVTATAPVAVLVVVGDGLPEPAEAAYRFRVLEGRVGAVVRMPFIPAFRLVAGSPAQVRLPRRARQALAQIRALAREQPPPYPSTPRPQGRS